MTSAYFEYGELPETESLKYRIYQNVHYFWNKFLRKMVLTRPIKGILPNSIAHLVDSPESGLVLSEGANLPLFQSSCANLFTPSRELNEYPFDLTGPIIVFNMQT